uniref:Ovule protein n=1 Tax=Haemonchus placei TaxID=6290 RepID=A0A0N4XBQ4_HAEPC
LKKKSLTLRIILIPFSTKIGSFILSYSVCQSLAQVPIRSVRLASTWKEKKALKWQITSNFLKDQKTTDN